MLYFYFNFSLFIGVDKMGSFKRKVIDICQNGQSANTMHKFWKIKQTSLVELLVGMGSLYR